MDAEKLNLNLLTPEERVIVEIYEAYSLDGRENVLTLANSLAEARTTLANFKTEHLSYWKERAKAAEQKLETKQDRIDVLEESTIAAAECVADKEQRITQLEQLTEQADIDATCWLKDRKGYEQRIAQLEAKRDELWKVLEKIADPEGDGSDQILCECNDHTSEDCCNNSSYCCPMCIAGAALLAKEKAE